MQGRYAEAERDYLEAGRQDPRNAGALYGAGLCEYREGNLSNAATHLQGAVALNPALTQARTLWERVHKLLTAQQVQDLRFSLLMKEGVLYYRMHQYNKAMDSLEKAAALNPRSADLHFNLGLVDLKLKKWDKADAELEECLKLNPGDKRAEYALGVLFEKVGGLAEAQNYFLSVAQSPSAGIYNLEAMHRLSTLHSEVSYSPFHFSIRLQGGGAQNTPDQYVPGNPPVTNRSVNEYGHLQLSYSPLLGKTIVNLSYGGDGMWSQAPGQNPYFSHLHDFSIGCNLPLPGKWIMPLSCDEQVGFSSDGTLNYQHHQASLAFQWPFKDSDMIQAQVQYLREIFPSPVNLDSNNWIGTLSALMALGGHFFNLSYSFRQSLEDAASMTQNNPTDFSFSIHSLSLVYHVEFGGGWNATLNYTPQWQTYPFFEDGGPRSDWIQNISGEFTIPADPHWNFVVGDQYQKLQSTDSTYSQHSNNYYVGTQVFF